MIDNVGGKLNCYHGFSYCWHDNQDEKSNIKWHKEDKWLVQGYMVDFGRARTRVQEILALNCYWIHRPYFLSEFYMHKSYKNHTDAPRICIYLFVVMLVSFCEFVSWNKLF